MPDSGLRLDITGSERPAREAASLARSGHAPRTWSITASAVVHGLLALIFLWLVPAVPSDDQAAMFNALTADSATMRETEPHVAMETPSAIIESQSFVSGGQSAALEVGRQPVEVNVTPPRDAVPSLASMLMSRDEIAADIAAFRGSVVLKAEATGSGSGTGRGDGIGSDNGPGFFGMTPFGKRYVYVLDCSRSMNHPHDSEAKTRFKRMKMEVVKSITALPENAEFFLIFFNTEAIAMPANGAVSATGSLKEKYLRWMVPLAADGDTDPSDAMRLAARLNPDEVYFLTDGSFTFKVQQELLKLPLGRAALHTFVFETPLSEEQLLALEHLQQDRVREARSAVKTNKDFRIARATFEAQDFMARLATAHHGRFILIPHHDPAPIATTQAN